MPREFQGPAAEKTDIHPRWVAGVGAVILLTLALVIGAVWGILRLWHMSAEAGPNAPGGFRTDAPRLQSAPQDERAAYFAEKEHLLHSYGWVDRQAGTARIPIEVAMDLLAARGAKPVGPGEKP